MPTKTKRQKKQRIDLSSEDISRLDHILESNALEDRSSACKFSIHRLVTKLPERFKKLASRIDQESESDSVGEVSPWGFVCKENVRQEIDTIRYFYAMAHISSTIRLAIRVQAATDGWGKTR